MAAEQAAAIYANAEAVGQYGRAIEAGRRSGIAAGELARLEARRSQLLDLSVTA